MVAYLIDLQAFCVLYRETQLVHRPLRADEPGLVRQAKWHSAIHARTKWCGAS